MCDVGVGVDLRQLQGGRCLGAAWEHLFPRGFLFCATTSAALPHDHLPVLLLQDVPELSAYKRRPLRVEDLSEVAAAIQPDLYQDRSQNYCCSCSTSLPLFQVCQSELLLNVQQLAAAVSGVQR